MGYETIAAEMTDPQLKALVEKIGYNEGMPVVTDPGIIRPEVFINEVIFDRLPNPYMPDTPQRIAVDTSQKIPIRFGETIKSYMNSSDLNVGDLKYIPLVIAGWLRYLLAVDDNGKPFACSSDPMLETLQAQLSTVKLGDPNGAKEEVLRPILSNSMLFGVDLVKAGLAETIIAMLTEMLAGSSAVRNTLIAYLG